MKSPTIDRANWVYIFCVSLFITSLLGAVLTSQKVHVYDLFGWSVLIPAGTALFCLTYLATDVISEVWGRAHALAAVAIGIAMRALILLYFYFAIGGENIIPFISNAPFWSDAQQTAYASVLGGTQRIILAGFVSFCISSMLDVFIFHYFKRHDKAKNRLWVRNNFSTMFSQTINSVVFIFLAFGAQANLEQIGSLILGQVVVKLLLAFIDTPLIYLLRNIALGKRLLDVKG